ncbi:hypothetical protein BCR39DRAFT_290672 [Naematelia encephala]|uniref:F-box domain-containing protein n=1 Tax=Naematelia encephala TaxID=71784 RepID=A0A1Y2ARZ8_9TREE|nr:hypothetical protein BCR39DRAFT_290672 [Naematelia encephala]
MLHTVPPEVLSHIALHLTLPQHLPTPPVPLLLTSKAIHSTLAPSTNPRLYARLFRAAFDIEAAERRAKGEIHASDIVCELEKRTRCLGRLSRMVQKRDVSGVTDSDLWVIYTMLIENDGKNLQHLLSKDFHLPAFIQLYHEQNLLMAAVEPGYPSETVGRALVMWIAWLLSTHGGLPAEPPEQRDERLFVLRPYVFAAQQYELYFAPWTIPDLPTAAHAPAITQTGDNPFIADLEPRSRRVTIEHFGRQVALSPPILAHAAMLLFFTRRSSADNMNGDLDLPAPFTAIGDRAPASYNIMNDNENGNGIGYEESDEQDEWTTRSLIASSNTHDRDYRRLVACYDASVCRGMPRGAFRGAFDGNWEGNFSFFDFDAFRDMLAGQTYALYEGPFGEQAQVWRLKETFVRRKQAPWHERKGKGKGKAKATVTTDDEGLENGEGMEDVTAPRGLPMVGPMTNAGFPTDVPPSSSAGLASASAEAITLRETIQQQVEALEGYEMVPEDELEDALEDGGEEQGVEMLLTGTGHSAWGRFILKGRVRGWDGMASLVKEYAPDSRGKWIYRGYVLGGDTFVGRWRDTFTPEEYVGYEGTFILNRR